MALSNFNEPKPGMSSAIPRSTPRLGIEGQNDLKAMALGIQAWLDGSGEVGAGEPQSAPDKPTATTAKQRTPKK